MEKENMIYGNTKHRYATLNEWIDAERSTGYDLRGYIDKYGVPDQSKGQHLTDEFKLPNHITFSDQSIYSNDQTPGGRWEEIKGKWHYTPSDHVLKTQGREKLINYFKDNEPDSVLRLP